MSNLHNPYAPPSVEADGEPAALAGPVAGLRRDGDLVMVPAMGTIFPPRCVRCNAPAGRRLGRKLYWHPQGYYFLLFVSAIVYVVAAMIVRKRAELEIGLCEEHFKRRKNGILIGWLGFAGSLLALILFAEQSVVLVVLLVLAMLALPITGIVMAQVISAKRIDKQNAWLKVGKPFLESIG